tara:strand:+ start:10888 stop:11751 length:864 start_codon:yes stop_codon:yes gene_type:complete
MSIIVFGDTILDIFTVIDLAGQNPDQNGDKKYTMPNPKDIQIECGGALNVAENIKSMDKEATYYGYYDKQIKSIANSKLKQLLEIDNIRTVKRYVDRETGTHLLRLDSQEQYKLLQIPSKKELENAKVLIFSDYLHGTINSNFVSNIQNLSQAPIIIDTRNPLLWLNTKNCIFKLNKKEWITLLREDSLQMRSNNTFIVTDGPYPVKLYNHISKKLTSKIFVPKVNVIDTTGAGDVFVAAMAIAMTKDMSEIESVEYACSLASLSVTLLGTEKITIEYYLKHTKLSH